MVIIKPATALEIIHGAECYLSLSKKGPFLEFDGEAVNIAFAQFHAT